MFYPYYKNENHNKINKIKNNFNVYFKQIIWIKQN